MRAWLRWPAACYHKCLEEFWERRLGIRTKGGVPATGDEPGRHAYAPASYAAFHYLLRQARVRYEETVFVDYGSGKGRIVCAASRFPFQRVIGVELSPDLSAESRRNIGRLRRPRAGAIEVATEDATAFALPPHPLVLFFYNPFSGQILERVLERVHEALSATGQAATILYINDEKFKALCKARDIGWIRQDLATRKLHGHYSCGVYTARA